MTNLVPAPRDLPLVSIVTPSFQQGRFVRDAIESVLAQDYPAIEYIVVDGGSTDETLEVLAGYGERVHWTSGPDAGQSDAINRGFAMCRGSIIAWLNADDRYLPGAVSQAAAVFREEPAVDLVYGDATFVNRLGQPLGPERYGEPWNFRAIVNRVNYIVQPAAFFRRSAFEAVGGLDPNLHYVMDYDLWIKLGRRGAVRYVPRVFAEVRMYPETKTSSGGLPRYDEMEDMLRRHGRRALPVDFQPEILACLAQESWRAATDRDLRKAAHLARRALPYALRVAGRRGVRATRTAVRSIRGTDRAGGGLP